MGSAAAPSLQYSSRDLNSHTKLKLRAMGQGAPEEVEQRDLRAELFELEARRGREGAVEAAYDDDVDVVLTTLGDDDEEGNAPSEDDEDDTEALLRELEKIKQEREAEKQRKLEEEQRQKYEKSVSANPLIASPSFAVKRRWDDDVVFKNQASSVVDKPSKRFINDTLRSDFHRKFLNRYIK